MSLRLEDHRVLKSCRSDPLAGSLTTVLTLILLFATPTFVQADGKTNILFVSSQTSTHYLRFIEETKLELQAGDPLSINTTSLSAGQLTSERMIGTDHSYDMIVALGSQAAQAIQQWQPKAPVLYTLIPRLTYDSLKKSGKLACPDNQCTAIYIDQPLPRLFRILSSAFGTQRDLGVLLGPVSILQRDRLVKLAAETGFSLHTAAIRKQHELLPALNNILKQSDLLLSLPDPVVYNRRTAKSILLTTYRYRVPVVAYSKAYADAGAALSIYSTPEQIARQTARLIRDFFANGRPGLPMPQYPEYCKIRINEHVTDSLGLDFDTNPELQSIIKEVDNE